MNVEQVARWAVNMGAKPEIVAKQYADAAADLRAIAVKAAASKTGKFRNYTAEQAERLAAEQEARAVQVPELMRRALGGAA